MCVFAMMYGDGNILCIFLAFITFLLLLFTTNRCGVACVCKFVIRV